MDWNAIAPLAVVVSAVGAVAAALIGAFSWRLQHVNHRENLHYKERLREEEHYFKLHLLWQELRIAAVTLQNLPPASSEYAPQVAGLPIESMSEALATKKLLSADAATKVRIARDALVQIEQIAADGRNAEARKITGFERAFPELLVRTLSNLDEARQAIIQQLPGE